MNRHDLRQLAAKLEHHAEEEGRIIEQYRALSEGLGRSPAGMLVNQILTEEEMHHLLLRMIATWLSEDPSSHSNGSDNPNRGELLRLTETLRRHESATIESCRALLKEIPNQGNEVVSTLLDTMALDSDKHRRLLNAVERILGNPSATASAPVPMSPGCRTHP